MHYQIQLFQASQPGSYCYCGVVVIVGGGGYGDAEIFVQYFADDNLVFE